MVMVKENKNAGGDKMGTVFVTIKKFNSMLRRQEKKNIEREGHSLTSTSIGNAVRGCIREIRDDIMVVDENWLDRIETIR